MASELVDTMEGIVHLFTVFLVLEGAKVKPVTVCNTKRVVRTVGILIVN